MMRRKIKPLGDVIDTYTCLRCGATVTTNADAETFSTSPPLECQRCPGQPGMDARRYVPADLRRSLPALKTVLASFRSGEAHVTEEQITAAWREFDGL